MKIEIQPQNDPILPMFQAPIVEPGLRPEQIDCAYTPKQRQWWLRVYQNQWGLPQCAFPEYTEEQGFVRCEYTHPEGKGLEIHHIKPSSFIKVQEPWRDPNAIESTLAIAVCKPHHDKVIHPDVGYAISHYHQDKAGIAKAIHEHHELAKSGIVFWDNSYDQMLLDTAQQAVQVYVVQHPLDAYPVDVSWQKHPHPPKKHWSDGIFPH